MRGDWNSFSQLLGGGGAECFHWWKEIKIHNHLHNSAISMKTWEVPFLYCKTMANVQH